MEVLPKLRTKVFFLVTVGCYSLKSEGLLEEITKYPYLTANCYSMDICFLETKVVGLG